MGVLAVSGLLIGGFIVLIALVEQIGVIRHRKYRDVLGEHNRDAWNAESYRLWEPSGWYPHELENGKVRWYRVRHDDAVDHGGAATR